MWEETRWALTLINFATLHGWGPGSYICIEPVAGSNCGWNKISDSAKWSDSVKLQCIVNVRLYLLFSKNWEIYPQKNLEDFPFPYLSFCLFISLSFPNIKRAFGPRMHYAMVAGQGHSATPSSIWHEGCFSNCSEWHLCQPFLCTAHQAALCQKKTVL